MGLPPPRPTDADLIDRIDERLRQLSAGIGDDDVRFLDLTPYLQRVRYYDTAFDDYGWWGWDTTVDYDDDWATQSGLCGLMKVGSLVQGFGAANMNPMPYDPADRNRFYPSPTYAGPAGNPYETGPHPWSMMTDDERREISLTAISSLWTGLNQDVWDANGPSVGEAFYYPTSIPVDFLPWPTGTMIRPLIDRNNTESSYCDAVEFDFFAGTRGDCACVQVRESGGAFYLPDPADLAGLSGDDPDVIPSTQDRVFDSLAFGTYAITLENIRYIALDGHPDLPLSYPGDRIDFPWTD